MRAPRRSDRRGFDLAIRAGALPDSTLVVHALPAAPFRICASPGYLARRGVPRHPAQLRDHDCLVMISHRRPATWEFRQGRRAITIEVRGRLRINNLAILTELAIVDHGIARLPDGVGNRALASGALRCLLERYTPPALPWHAVYPSARNLSRKVRAFVALLEQHLGPRGARSPRP